MAVQTASQVVSSLGESRNSGVTQRRLFKKKKLAGIPHPPSKALPEVPITAGSSLVTTRPRHQADVVSMKDFTSNRAKPPEDDTKALEAWLASYSQFGDDPEMERKARVYRKDGSYTKRTVNKVYACWLEPGDTWGDPDFNRHNTHGGYPTREKYEQRSGYSLYVRRRWHLVFSNPSAEMLKTVWDWKTMSSFKPIEGFEYLGRPPTLDQILSKVPWSSKPLASSSDKNVLTNGLYGTAVNDEELLVHPQDGTSEKVVVTDLSGNKHVFHPVERHRKKYEWFLANELATRPVLDHKKVREFIGPPAKTKFVLDAGSRFRGWSRHVSGACSREMYERHWLEDDQRRYEYYLAEHCSGPVDRTPLEKVLLAGVPLKETEGHPLVPVGPVSEDYPDYVKKMAVRFNVHPDEVVKALKYVEANDYEGVMPEEEYKSLVNVEEVVSATAEKIAHKIEAAYTSEVGLDYFEVNGILVPGTLVENQIVVVSKLRDVVAQPAGKSGEVIEDAVYTQVTNQLPAVPQTVDRTPAERAGLKPREQMNALEKVVDQLRSWGILSPY